MRWSVLLLAIVTGALVVLGPSVADGRPSTNEHGQKLYLRYCSSCHGPTGKGDGLLAEAMKREMPNLTQIAIRRNGDFPRREIAAYIDGRNEVREHGSRLMPVWGDRLSDAAPFVRPRQKEGYVSTRIRALVAYLESIQRQE